MNNILLGLLNLIFLLPLQHCSHFLTLAKILSLSPTGLTFDTTILWIAEFPPVLVSSFRQ